MSRMLAFILFFMSVMPLYAVPAPEIPNTFEPLDKETEEALKAIGAVSKLDMSSTRSIPPFLDHILLMDRHYRNCDVSKMLPAVRFQGLVDWTQLPKIEAAFGIECSPSSLTLEDVKKIAKYKNLRALHLHGVKINDAMLEVIAEMKSLQSLSFQGGFRLTNAGLNHLDKLRNLTHLSIFNAEKINDNGLKELKNLTKLVMFNMSGGTCTKACIDYFEGLRRLRCLNLPSVDDEMLIRADELGFLHAMWPFQGEEQSRPTSLAEVRVVHFSSTVRGDAFALLKKCKNLETLLCDSRILHDAAFRHLIDAGLLHKYGYSYGLKNQRVSKDQEIVFVQLNSGAITGECLRNLTTLSEGITALSTNSSWIGDADLAQFKQFKNLKHLHLVGTEVTAAGIADLKKHLPNCEIRHNLQK